jgi:pyridoxamine 5'-phosphate oxidase
MSDLPLWRSALAAAVDKTASSPPTAAAAEGNHWAQLSTIRSLTRNRSVAGRPAARTVNLRGLTARRVRSPAVSSNSIFWFISDSRSDKVADIRACAFAELVLFFPSAMSQMRCSGKVIVRHRRGDDGVDEVWQSLGERDRRYFAWPAPGQPRADDVGSEPDVALFDAQAPGIATCPSNFVVCRLEVDFVEYLDLAAFPPVRFIQEKLDGAWGAPRHVNP